MVNRYRVLGAMLALQEFTPQQLADYSGVKEQTVRTVLNREKGRYREVGTLETGRPGGQPRLLRLNPGATDEIRAELQQLYRDLPDRPSGGAWASEWATEDGVPLPLLAADNALREQLPEAHTEEAQRRLFDLAKATLRTAQQQLDGLPESGRRHEDLLYRAHLKRLNEIVDRVERGELRLQHVPDEMGEPLSIPAEEPVPVVEAEPVFVLLCTDKGTDSPDAGEELWGTHTGAFEGLAQKIRVAANKLGVAVLERRTETDMAAETRVNPVILMYDSSHGWPGARFWTVVNRAGDRVVILDYGTNDSLRNEVLAHRSLYLGHAGTLNVTAIEGTLSRLCVRATPTPAPAVEGVPMEV